MTVIEVGAMTQVHASCSRFGFKVSSTRLQHLCPIDSSPIDFRFPLVVFSDFLKLHQDHFCDEYQCIVKRNVVNTDNPFHVYPYSPFWKIKAQ